MGGCADLKIFIDSDAARFRIPPRDVVALLLLMLAL
jgi:hypothetical protein